MKNGLYFIEFRFKIREEIDRNIPIRINTLAEENAHNFQYKPLYFSDRQPVELVSPHIKENLGRMYNSQMAMRQVMERHNSEFENFSITEDRNTIDSIISHVWTFFQKTFST